MKLWCRPVLASSVLAAVLAVIDRPPARADAGHGHALPGVGPGQAEEVDRTIRIAAVDVAFEPETIEVRVGETIRFVVTNRGMMVHDFTLGDPETQRAHRDAMAESMMGEINGGDEHQDDHAHAHAHHNAIMLQPGETRDLTWTFAAAEAFEFGCNIPGHYESGMFGEITILPRQDVTGPSV